MTFVINRVTGKCVLCFIHFDVSDTVDLASLESYRGVLDPLPPTLCNFWSSRSSPGMQPRERGFWAKWPCGRSVLE